MVDTTINPPCPPAARVDWMWDVSVERVLDDPPDLLGWAADDGDPSVETTPHRIRRDVDALCVTPRHREGAGSLEAARAHCRDQLEAAGWSVDERTFHPRPALRISDAGHPHSPLAMRWLSNLQGVNLVAVPDGRPWRPRPATSC